MPVRAPGRHYQQPEGRGKRFLPVVGPLTDIPDLSCHGTYLVNSRNSQADVLALRDVIRYVLAPIDMITSTRRRQEVSPTDRVATDMVTRFVRGKIIRGEIHRGERLPPERELVREIGVSRTTVRAGLQLLAAKGVLVIRHGAGTFVADGPPVLDSEPLRFLAALHGFSRAEMFEARRTLEVGVAGMAAERATSDDIAAIADEVTNMFASLHDPQAFLIHDIRFHRKVAAASANPILGSLVEMVSAVFYERRRRTANRARDLRPTGENHRQIYQAIRDHDRARAQTLMYEHLLVAEREQESEGPDVHAETEEQARGDKGI